MTFLFYILMSIAFIACLINFVDIARGRRTTFIYSILSIACFLLGLIGVIMTAVMGPKT